MKSVPKNILKKAKNIKLIAMDVDGVLTGGEIIVFDSGEEIKIWDVRDRFAFYFIKLASADIKFAWITGRETKQVSDRAKEIGIDFLYQGCMWKKDALNEIILKLGLKPAEVAYLGDDIVDIPCLRLAGFAVAPKDAPVEIRNEADYVSKAAGGKGVLREVVEIVLEAKGLWKKVLYHYLSR